MKTLQNSLWVALILASPRILRAAEDSNDTLASLRPFFQQYCCDCHSGESSESGLDLAELVSDPQVLNPNSFDTWVKVHDRLASREMPPAEAVGPNSSERQASLKLLSSKLHTTNSAQLAEQGRVQLRRLNRVEYEYTLRDLLALPNLEVADMLPADAQSQGFDTVGAALNISYVQLERYLEAATLALDQAMSLGPKPIQQHTRLPAMTNGRLAQVINKGKEAVPIGDAVGLLRQPNSAQAPWWWSKYEPPKDGMYHIRMKAFGFLWDRGQILPADRAHALTFLAVQQSTKRPLGTFDVANTAEDASVLELDAFLRQGDQIQFWIETLSDRTKPDRIDMAEHTSPGVAVEWLEVDGPLHQQWPPASYVRLFGDLPSVVWTEDSGLRQPPLPMITDGVGKRAKPVRANPNKFTQYRVDSKHPEADARRLVRDFVQRAYRRPVEEDELSVYLGLVSDKIEAGECFQEAMKVGYQAVLCSPDFLFMHHPAGRLDNHALATRLAYFLWKSSPDDELLACAAQRGLTAAAPLRLQVERMLNDPKSKRFVEDFTGQWLDLQRISVTQPDAQLYPEFDGLLLDSMVQETHAYFAEMLQRDLGLDHIVASDFAMLNGRLAEHYGIDGISGVAIRRVLLPDESPRGGLLTQASILKVTANGTSTSPVTRGVWIVDRILGQSVPPPPPNIPAVEPDLRGTTTIREQLAKHRDDESCAVCHRRIDPPGFALENFDVIGGWREHYRALGEGDPIEAANRDRPVAYKSGLAVDASGEDQAGQRFDGIQGFRQIMLAQQVQLARSMVEKLLVYSTGADIQFADRRVIDAILENSRASGYGLRTIIHQIVQSHTFQTK